jgi:hypothetical protein
VMFKFEGCYAKDRKVEKILSDVNPDHYCRWRNGPDCAARG